MLEFRSAARFASVPFVESGISRCGRIYSGMKGSSALFARCCSLAELSAGASVSLLARPALRRLAGPLGALDDLLCALLESVERAAPSVYLPPEMMLSSAQEYVSCRIVEPVLKRADSVKRIGNRAADGLDGALDAADLYVDKYLPPDGREEPRAPAADAAEDPGAHRAVRTIRHVDRLTRKLSRRLTRRTLREARALGEHTAEAIHVLAYAAELAVTDPRAAWLEAKRLWATLSEDEPENQARPDTLEHLVVMLTRETARRIVHFLNFVKSALVELPEETSHRMRRLLRRLSEPIERVRSEVGGRTRLRLECARTEAQRRAGALLEQVAIFIAGNSEREKLPSSGSRLSFDANSAPNGVN